MQHNNEQSDIRIGLTRVEAAKAIGVSPRTIDNLIADRQQNFPVCRVGRKIIIPIDELKRWLSTQVVEAGS